MTYINISNAIFNLFINDLEIENDIFTSLDDSIPAYQFEYHIDQNGIKHYNFIEPDAEIRRDDAQKTVKFIGNDADIYRDIFETFLKAHLNHKFIPNQSIPIRKKVVRIKSFFR